MQGGDNVGVMPQKRAASLPKDAPAVVKAALDIDRGFDVVVHAGASGVKPNEQDAVGLVDGNVGVTAAIIDAVGQQKKKPRLLFTSSSAVYGPVEGAHRSREDDDLRPANVYGAAKVAAEVVGAAVAAKAGVPFVVLRLFGVYGPREAKHRMVPYLARALADGARPSLTPGAQQRDWIYVADVAAAVVAAISIDAGVYNVCSGVPVAVRDVARAVGRVVFAADAADAADLDVRVGLGARPYRSDEPMFVVGDPGRFSAATGWRPTTPLEVGIAATVRWALAHRSVENAP